MVSMKSPGTVTASRRARDDGKVVRWLLDGDPAIRWQALRDVVGATDAAVEREQCRVAREGWGARLLAKMGDGGLWSAGRSTDGGLYSPKWVSTTYTLLLLRDLGLPRRNRRVRKACRTMLDEGLRKDGGVNYGSWGNRGETCITGMVLSILSWFELDDERLDVIADHLLEQQMKDGGWNCRRFQGATHSSVHTTISALEGLHLYEKHRGRKMRAVRAAQLSGREFLLAHRMFRSHRTGEIINPVFLRMAFPPRWHYDVLRGLDYFRAVRAPRDERLAEAIELIRGKRDEDGRWPLEHEFRGKTWFRLESLGKPSRWNTLRALRVLKWWEPRARMV